MKKRTEKENEEKFCCRCGEEGHFYYEHPGVQEAELASIGIFVSRGEA